MPCHWFGHAAQLHRAARPQIDLSKISGVHSLIPPKHLAGSDLLKEAVTFGVFCKQRSHGPRRSQMPTGLQSSAASATRSTPPPWSRNGTSFETERNYLRNPVCTQIFGVCREALTKG